MSSSTSRPHHRRARRLGRLGVFTAALATTTLAAASSVGLIPVPTGVQAVAAQQVGQADSMWDPIKHVVSALSERYDTSASPQDEKDSERLSPRGDAKSDLADRTDRALARSAKKLPADSGKGRRVVFDMSAQRVWLVRADGDVASTYKVSGSKHDNLEAGRYAVYSRSKDAVGYNFDSTMRYFVRFTRGDNAAIGFHDIPVDNDGEKVQTVKQLGEPLSAGCIRQRATDAKRMWRFASIDTPVVVLD